VKFSPGNCQQQSLTAEGFRQKTQCFSVSWSHTIVHDSVMQSHTRVNM